MLEALFGCYFVRVDRNANLEILSLWKASQFRFLKLASMARDVLSIPISTVASESTFSVGGRVIDQFRSSLRLNTVEALVCTRDWLDKEKCNLICFISYYYFYIITI